MPIQKIVDSLTELLADTDEIWIASALVTDEGFNFIQSGLPLHAKQHYMVGIDLPTPVSVLVRMMELLETGIFEAFIFQPETGIFHPKLILIRSANSYTAFVGSANLTKSGLEMNVELSVQISEQTHCLKLLKWFQLLSSDAYPINADNIALYQNRFDQQAELHKKLKATPPISLKKGKPRTQHLDNIDFSDRYFSREQHYAFRQALTQDTSAGANKERKNVYDRFIDLHEQIYPQFRTYGLNTIEPNKPPHVVSMFYHTDAATGKNIGAMWLSYGKSPQQIKEYRRGLSGTGKYGKSEEDDKQSFINHSRLQVRIDLKEIGIWILFGKNNGGSIYDRDYFFKNMKDESYRLSFFSQLKILPRQYWIRVNNVQVTVSEFHNADTLYEFCKKDNPKEYFIIGRDYAIEDKEMSEQSLPKTVLTEFKRLLPLYLLMRHKF